MINKVILIGNLGRDPEVRHLESGVSVARFSVATNESYQDKNKEWQSFFENNTLLAAVNHDMVDENHPVKAGDEVAFFPPVTGG